MGTVFKQDREQAFAKTALALMGGAGVVATPENFELFYAYASGENPAIAQVMGAIIESKRTFTPELLADLRLRCLSGARAAAVMESLKQLRESPDYELCQLAEQKLGVLDELAAERAKQLEVENAELEKQAEELAIKIKKLADVT